MSILQVMAAPMQHTALGGGTRQCVAVILSQYLLIFGFGGLCWLVSDGVPCNDNLHYVGAEPLVLWGEVVHAIAGGHVVCIASYPGSLGAEEPKSLGMRLVVCSAHSQLAHPAGL